MEEKTKYGSGYTCNVCGKYNRASTLCHHDKLISDNMEQLISTEEIFGKFYDNQENLSQEEILQKMRSLGHGPNRNKRFSELALYGDTEITREQWITKYTTK